VASAVAMSPLPVDLGEGVVLRRYEMSDLDALWDAIDEERARLGEWMPFVDGVRTIEDERAWLESVMAGASGVEGGGLWSGSEFLGGVGSCSARSASPARSAIGSARRMRDAGTSRVPAVR
jgi:hypothetical protein